MKVKGEQFRFKQFAVSHSQSSMKVGVDGVLVGAWGNVEGRKGLDVGCGCGLIALMAAQRNPHAHILGIDLHQKSAEEAEINFKASPWTSRLTSMSEDIFKFIESNENKNSFDFIISNPPFFNSGIANPLTPREIARHESALSPSSLLDIADILLGPNGKLSLILPLTRRHEVENHPTMLLERICIISDRPDTHPKRIMAVLSKNGLNALREELLYIRDTEGSYSETYKELTKDFYLAF